MAILWTAILAFTMSRLIKGDWKRLKDPDTWDFMFYQQLCIEMVVCIYLAVTIHMLLGSFQVIVTALGAML